jgi:hypothetical protein
MISGYVSDVAEINKNFNGMNYWWDSRVIAILGQTTSQDFAHSSGLES